MKMKNYKIQLGEKIKLLRKSKGITQEQLAEMVNRSKNHISKIELGKANPPISLIFEISSALKIYPVELFNFSNYPLNKNIDLSQNLKYKKLIEAVLSAILNNL